jgi:predicted NAD/FAD-binding protein
MTFGVSRDQGLFEWAGTSLSSIFAQKANLLQPRMWHMIFDIIRFNQFALDLLSDEDESEEDPSGANGSVAEGPAKNTKKAPKQQSIGEYLDQENYSEAFRNDYLIPMTASVWSTSPDKASLEFPAITLIRFMWNHHLLTTVAARPTWMTIMGGSKQYINAVMADFPLERVHLRTGIESLSILNNGQIVLQRMDRKREVYDHVILATHGDQAMEIIRNVATPEETEIISGFKTSENSAVLHSDLSVRIAIILNSVFQSELLKLVSRICNRTLELHFDITITL